MARHLLQPAPGSSFCEKKGPAQYWSLAFDARRVGPAANGGAESPLVLYGFAS